MMRLSFFISLFISLFGILIVQHLFTSSDPSKSEYYGYVGLTFVLPFILLSLFITYRFFHTTVKNTSETGLQITFVVVSALLLIFLAYYFNKYKNQITNDTTSFFPPLNEKTYQVYLNFYTFALIHTVSAMLGSIFGMFKSNKNIN